MTIQEEGYFREENPEDGACARPLRIGIGGTSASGKQTLAERLARKLNGNYNIAVITSDMRADEEALKEAGALQDGWIKAGTCAASSKGHSMNLQAIQELEQHIAHLDIIFIESTEDQMTASLDPEMMDRFIYIIDVEQGEQILRKNEMSLIRSDMLVINKLDFLPSKDESLQFIEESTRKVRGERPFVLSNLFNGQGLDDIASWVEHEYSLV